VSRRLPSLFFAAVAVTVYAVAIAAPGLGASAVRPIPRASDVPCGAVEQCHDVQGPHAPRSDEHLTRQREGRLGAGLAQVALPVAILAVAGAAPAVESGRRFVVECDRPRAQTRSISARSSRGPPI
jgi:hypothetical protein